MIDFLFDIKITTPRNITKRNIASQNGGALIAVGIEDDVVAVVCVCEVVVIATAFSPVIAKRENPEEVASK